MNVNTCPNQQLQRSIYFMCKFTWTWIHAPTNSYSVASTSSASSHEREYLHQLTATAKHLLHVQVHMNVNTCPNQQLQRSIYFMCKFTWTWVPAPTDSYSEASTSCASSHEREYLPQPTATAKHLLHVQVHTNLSTCPNRQPQRSIYFMCKFTWTWIQAPTDSYSVASTSCASSHEREYLP